MNRIAQIAALTLIVVFCVSRTVSQEDDSESAMRSHYDAAYRLLSAGKVDQADLEFATFLAASLGRLANGFSNTGDYARAKATFDEALRLAPGDPDTLRDYASAALTAKDYDKAAQILFSALALPPSTPATLMADVHLLRGKLQLATKGRQADLTDFRSAVELDPSCVNIYMLASAKLAVAGPAAAEKDYTRYRSSCGDTAAVRINIGRAYAINGSPDRAVVEFRAASVLNPRYPGVHYCLGAAYLQTSHSNFNSAEAEFRKELALHPNDRLSYAQLGHIAVLRHRNQEAEDDYRRAIALNPGEPSNFIELGQLLAESDRGLAAEPLLRKAIELTPDASRNSYAIERAHFLLGHILMKQGHQEDAQHELGIAANLLNQSRHQAEVDLTGENGSSSNPLAVTRIPSEQEKAQVELYVHRIGPVLASAYNNLGVHEANIGSFVSAVTDFAAAAHWNPTLQGIDANWGRAAYLAGQYSDAVAPLERAVHAHPADSELSDMLEVCRQHVAGVDQP